MRGFSVYSTVLPLVRPWVPFPTPYGSTVDSSKEDSGWWSRAVVSLPPSLKLGQGNGSMASQLVPQLPFSVGHRVHLDRPQSGNSALSLHGRPPGRVLIPAGLGQLGGSVAWSTGLPVPPPLPAKGRWMVILAARWEAGQLSTFPHRT